MPPPNLFASTLIFFLFFVVNYLRRWGVVITRRPTTVRWLMPSLSPLDPHYCEPVSGASSGPLFFAITFPDGEARFWLLFSCFGGTPHDFVAWRIHRSCSPTHRVPSTFACVQEKYVVVWDKLTLATWLTNEVDCWSVKNAHCCRVDKSLPCLSVLFFWVV